MKCAVDQNETLQVFQPDPDPKSDGHKLGDGLLSLIYNMSHMELPKRVYSKDATWLNVF